MKHIDCNYSSFWIFKRAGHDITTDTLQKYRDRLQLDCFHSSVFTLGLSSRMARSHLTTLPNEILLLIIGEIHPDQYSPVYFLPP